MKTILFTCFFISITTTLVAQEDYASVDSKILQIPSVKTYATDSIAKYILDYCKTDREKIRAVYTWITSNVEYSKDSMYYFRRWGTDPEEKMAVILRRRKGVCENYAALFANIVSKCGVQAVVITGYTKIGGSVNRAGHGWVAVNADSGWLLCDPTWDAGHLNSYNYFLVDPAEFISSHMPFDPMWQLLDHPITQQQFRQGTMRSKRDSRIFHYRDSIAVYLQSDTLQQMEATSRRMQAAGMENDNLKIWYTYNQMKINIVHQEENMQLFNDAVADLNKAKQLYNELVQYRNNNFTPSKTTEEVKALFTAIEKLIASSYQKMEAVGKKAENYQYDTDGLKKSLDKLYERVKKDRQSFSMDSEKSTDKKIK
jgi:hypothetical protein